MSLPHNFSSSEGVQLYAVSQSNVAIERNVQQQGNMHVSLQR